MKRPVSIAYVVAILALPSLARAERGYDPGGSIVVVKRAGVTVYEEVAEEFSDRCRVRARVLTLDAQNARAIRDSLGPSDVVLAVGQHAVDALAGSRAKVISALALATPPGVIPADALPPPELTLRALKHARPTIRRVGVVYGPHSDAMIRHVDQQAAVLGIELVHVRASDGPGAVRELRRLAPHVDALWLAPDLDVLTPQLFQYALSLEIRSALPIAAVTRQQVYSGALLAYDADPHAIGRQAADLAHQLLAGASPSALYSGGNARSVVELTVNGDAARRLGADVAALRALGARIE